MGFYSTQGATRDSIVAQILSESTDVIAHTRKGNTLWTIQRESAPGTRYFIGCYRLGGDRKYGWGYKPMDEGMGPCYYDVPLRYLDMQPIEHNEYAKAWRVKVRAFHAAAAQQKDKLKAIAVGATLVLKEGCTPARLTVVQVKPLRARSEQGGTFTVSARLVAEVIAREPVSC